jgi:heptosyltransferase I
MNIKAWKRNAFKKSSWIELFRFIKNLRTKKYDIVFDLQGNIKSGFVTFLSKSKIKVGFGFISVREWPNILSTNYHFNVDKSINIRLQYLSLIRQYFSDNDPFALKNHLLKISDSDKEALKNILLNENLKPKINIMVCFGSKWPNKQLSFNTLLEFLELIEKKIDASFLFVWGSDLEKEMAKQLNAKFLINSKIIPKLEFPLWQNLMSLVDLVIAFDSAALHLAGSIETKTFSIFGPTNPNVFKPLGNNHFSIIGNCPYKMQFIKQCPNLRSCKTGACIKDLKSDDIFNSFIQWWDTKKISCN